MCKYRTGLSKPQTLWWPTTKPGATRGDQPWSCSGHFIYSDNPQDNSEPPNQTYLDPPQETPSYSDNPDKCTFATPKPANSCLDKKANCWSAGVLDLDCPNSGLCCFDGCVNTCVDMKNEAHIQGNPDSSKQTFSAPVQDPGDEIYDVSLTESLEDYDPEEID